MSPPCVCWAEKWIVTCKELVSSGSKTLEYNLYGLILFFQRIAFHSIKNKNLKRTKIVKMLQPRYRLNATIRHKATWSLPCHWSLVMPNFRQVSHSPSRHTHTQFQCHRVKVTPQLRPCHSLKVTHRPVACLFSSTGTLPLWRQHQPTASARRRHAARM